MSIDLPDGFDLEALLAPIPGDLPQGIDIREDYSANSPYSRLRDARSNARDAERQAEAPDPDGPPPADPVPLWRSLRQIGLDVLRNNTKDLEVAAWLTEAFIRSDGLSGLAAGARLIAGLAERYWDDIYPLPDEFGVETRVGPITGLNGAGGGGSLFAPLYRLPLYRRGDGSLLTLQQYQASAKLTTLDASARQQRIDAGTAAFDEVEREARGVGRAAMIRLRDQAEAAVAAWQAMAEILEDKAGAEAPSTSQIRDLLLEVLAIANRYAPAPDASADDAGPIEAGSVGEAIGETIGVSVNRKPAGMTRDDALRTLEDIAAYFRRTEPHSPLSATLDEAVRRGRMPWMELLAELVEDRTVRAGILSSLGIRPPPEGEGE